MVAFRRAVAGTAVTDWWDNGANAIAFSRGDQGFVAINRESQSVSVAVMTGLPAGTYCDVLSGGGTGAGCAGTSVVIDANGTVQLDLAANSAIAVHTGST
jgi:alpha-amylase